MLRHFLLVTAAVLFCSVFMNAQGLCPAGSSLHADKLICLMPDMFQGGLLMAGPCPPTQCGAPQGNGQTINDHSHDFGLQGFERSSLTPFNSALSTQASLLPVASPAAGLVFSWDPTAKVFSASTDSLGPILGERADTIGRHRLFVGVAYQYFNFNKMDGLNLRRQQDAVLPTNDVTLSNGFVCSPAPPDGPNNEGDPDQSCGFVRDVVKTSNRFDLKLHQVTTFITYGLTDRLDLSVVIPVESVRLAVSSNATIVPNSHIPGDLMNPPVHVFPNGTFVNTFSNQRSASGLGDITLRVKGVAWKGEHAGVAVGVDVRTPTGDALNFLGAGAAGVKPFVAWSYRSRISPHVLVGYEVNGSSQLAGDTFVGNSEKLPSRMTYAGGADVWLTKSVTADVDLIGQQVFGARRMAIGSFHELGACTAAQALVPCTSPPPFATPVTDTEIVGVTRSYNSTSLSVGGKFKLVSTLLITANVQIALNDGGLRAKPIPLIGVSYTF